MSSATFPEKLQELAGKYMRNYIFVITGTGGVNPDISQEFLEVTKHTRKSILIQLLKNFNRVKIIVFVESKRTAELKRNFFISLSIATDFAIAIDRWPLR